MTKNGKRQAFHREGNINDPLMYAEMVNFIIKEIQTRSCNEISF